MLPPSPSTENPHKSHVCWKWAPSVAVQALSPLPAPFQAVSALLTFRAAAFGAAHPVPPRVLQPLGCALWGLGAGRVEVQGCGGGCKQAGGGRGGRASAQLQLLELLLELLLASGVLAGAPIGGGGERGGLIRLQVGAAPRGAAARWGNSAPWGHNRAWSHFQHFWHDQWLALRKEKSGNLGKQLPPHRCPPSPCHRNLSSLCAAQVGGCGGFEHPQHRRRLLVGKDLRDPQDQPHHNTKPIQCHIHAVLEHHQGW